MSPATMAARFAAATDEYELDAIHDELTAQAADAAERAAIDDGYALACNQLLPVEAQWWRKISAREKATLTKMPTQKLRRVADRLAAGPLWGFRGTSPEQRAEILRQVGTMNVLAISGGRVVPLPDGVELPVAQGYRVRIRLSVADTYRVERIFARGEKEWLRGVREDVYAAQVAQAAYYASCYVSYDEGEWEAKR